MRGAGGLRADSHEALPGVVGIGHHEVDALQQLSRDRVQRTPDLDAVQVDRGARPWRAQKGKKLQQVNEAEGAAAAILAIANATSEGIRKVAESIQVAGGYEAVQLRVAEQYITQFGELAKSSNTMILPASVSDIGAMIAMAMNVITHAPQAPPASQ